MHQIHQLKNGLNVVHYYIPDSKVFHCALLIKGGARDEPKKKTGLAHFIEHTFFKGTLRRKPHQIMNFLEVLGGELNAYTTKEETCIHASVMSMHRMKAVEIISDLFYNSLFPEKELEKEKKVIMDEIHAYADAPYEQIYDDFEGIVFKNHPLGNPVLGEVSDIESFSRSDINAFMNNIYNMKEMVWVVAGSLPEDEVISMAKKHFQRNGYYGKTKRAKPSFRKATITEVKQLSQYHYITGCQACSFTDKKRYATILFNNILGGPGMNSRLSMNIREKYGYTYAIESGYHSFSDTGIFHIYFATDKKYFVKTKALISREIERMRQESISERRLVVYKRQLAGQVLMAQENKLNVMLAMARSALYMKRIPTIEEIIDNIYAITGDQVSAIAHSLLNPYKLSSLTYEPAG